MMASAQAAAQDQGHGKASHLPLRIISPVVRGFGRGSSDLGIPTANLSPEEGQFGSFRFDDLPTGIYWGFARIGKEEQVYTTACSIGYNPTYDNKTKTIEPHLIAPKGDGSRHASSCKETVLKDFYDQTIRLTLIGFLRPELPFEGLDKLILAIKADIQKTEELTNSADAVVEAEKVWVRSSDGTS